MSESIKVALVTALINGAVTWGVVSTKLDWLRHDIDKLDTRVATMETKK